MGMAAILSSDLDHLNKLLFLFPIDAPYEIWLESAKWFQKKMFEILNPSAIWPRSMNDLDLWHSKYFMYSFILLDLPILVT